MLATNDSWHFDNDLLYPLAPGVIPVETRPSLYFGLWRKQEQAR